jgi:hypothetical protein
LNAGILREINRQNNPTLADLERIFWVYDTRRLEEAFENLKGLDARTAGGELMLLWEPPSLDQRIASQSGLLSVMNSGAASQTEFLHKYSKAYPDLVLRIIVKSKMKSEARDMLDQHNVSERNLFPGLPGLCSWLKRYYGRAW